MTPLNSSFFWKIEKWRNTTTFLLQLMYTKAPWITLEHLDICSNSTGKKHCSCSVKIFFSYRFTCVTCCKYMHESITQNVDYITPFLNVGIQLYCNTSGDTPLNLLQFCIEWRTARSLDHPFYFLASKMRIHCAALMRHDWQCTT